MTENTKTKVENNYPVWYDGKRIDEYAFCRAFLAEHPMKYVGDSFFTVLGRVEDERKIRRAVFRKITGFVVSGMSREVSALMDVLRLTAAGDLPVQTDRIHVKNGTLFLKDFSFSEEKEFCRNRLPVVYDPAAPAPVLWLRFLCDLLEAEDILTLQEYMGYCLIPCVKAQKMLLITGKGGEGKSRVGLVMKALLGDNMVTGSVNKVETDRFARADLEHRLLMVDDDLKLETLPQASTLKTIITAEQPLDLERKGRQSYQGTVYCRFLVLGNGTLKAAGDTSRAFFRRQIILRTRLRDPWREDDPYLIEKLLTEQPGIFNWCLEGLNRLVTNRFRFTESEQAKNNIQIAEAESNNAGEFLTSDGYVTLTPEGEVSSQRLYEAYVEWCRDNALEAMPRKAFTRCVNDVAQFLGLTYVTNINIGAGRRARGYTGIKLLSDE